MREQPPCRIETEGTERVDRWDIRPRLTVDHQTSNETTDGAAVEYVWDVFDKHKQRMQRVNDVLEVKGEGADSWLIVGDDALTSVAAKSADDLAAYLSNTPEAVAAAPAPAPPIAVSESKPLSYAPVN